MISKRRDDKGRVLQQENGRNQVDVTAINIQIHLVSVKYYIVGD